MALDPTLIDHPAGQAGREGLLARQPVGRGRQHCARAAVQLAKVAVPPSLFAKILRQIDQRRGSPVLAT